MSNIHSLGSLQSCELSHLLAARKLHQTVLKFKNILCEDPIAFISGGEGGGLWGP